MEQEHGPGVGTELDRDVRGGDRLTAERVRLLLAELDRAVAAHSCPHGRPVWVRIPRARLEAMFRRSG